MSLFDDAQPVLNILILVLASFSFGAVFYNGLTGTGATRLALIMQFVFALIYILLIEVSITWLDGNLVFAWMAEVVYWGLILLGSIWYIRTKNWHKLKV
jgi:Na+-driven multidrug efflux pump